MIILLVVTGILGVMTLIVFFKKLLKMLGPKSHDNPYIKLHLTQMKNDKDYDEYIDWMSKNKIDGIPLDKVETEAEKKHNKLVRRLLE